MRKYITYCLHVNCFMLCVASIHTVNAMEETLEKPSAPPMYEELPPAYDDLYQANESELLKIDDNWNAQDIDILLDEMERTLNEGGDLEKYFLPTTWVNIPVTTIKQLDRLIALQYKIIHNNGIQNTISITDIRLCATEKKLTEYQIQFLASIPCIRIFRITCNNAHEQLMPIIQHLAQFQLLELQLSCKKIQDNALLALKNTAKLRKIQLSSCKEISDSALKTFIKSLPTTITTLALCDTNLSDNILLEDIPKFQRLRIFSIGDCPQLSPGAISILLTLLPDTIERLHLSKTKLTDEGLNKISRFQKLKTLNISYCESLSTSGLENLLVRLPEGMEELDLSETSLTIEGMIQATRFQGLKKLSIRKCPLLPLSVIEYIIWRLPEGLTFTNADNITRTIRKRHLRPPKVVDLKYSRLSSEDLNRVLTFLPDTVEELHLTKTNLTDKCLEQIARFHGLKKLNLRSCKSLSGSALERLLARLPEDMEELDLRDTALTDEGLEQIARFHRLKKLSINECWSLSTSAVKNILWKLPDGLVFMDVNEKTRTIDKRMQESPRKEVGCGCTV